MGHAPHPAYSLVSCFIDLYFIFIYFWVLFPSWEGGVPPGWWILEDLQWGDWALGLNPGEAGGSL